MGVLRQFGALLWKNYVLRKRKPVFLLLEVLWPVIIFVVIALVRRGVPPVPSESCYYQERALPSAGMLPFLQTSVCTLNNPCLSQGQVEQKAAAQERLRSMLYKVEPYIRKNTTLEAFEVLPTIAKVFHTLKTKLNDTVLEEFGDRLVLKNLLRDEEKIVDILVDEYKLMSAEQARDLLESSLNPYEFVKAISNIDFKDVACDKTKLTKYVFFPKRTDVAAVSASLCAIDDDLISNITNEVVRQIDIVNLIKFGEEFAKFMGEFDYAVLLHDIADLMEVYIDKSGLLAAITDLPDLSIIPKMFDKMAEIIPAFEKLGAIDMESIWALYDLMYPFMDSVISDESTKDVLRQTADSLKEWTTSLNSNSNVSDIDFRKMVNFTSSLTEVFNSMGNMSYISDILDSMNFNSLYETLEAFVNGYKWDDVLLANMQSANMAGLENLARSMLPNTTVTMMMEISYKVTEMLINMMDSYSAMDAELRYFVTMDKDVMDTNVLNIFIQMGPKMTTAFMTEILKPTTYEPLILGKTDTQSLCKNITHKIYGEKERAVADYWNTYLCSRQMVDRFEQLPLGSIYQDSMTQMESSMEYVSYVIENPDSVTKPANMSMVYAKISQLANQTTHIFMDNTKLWTDILTDGPYDDYNTGDEAEWYYAWSNVSSAMFMTDMVLSMKQMGESMEGTELWTYLMPSAVAMEAYMAAQAEPYRMMQEMMDPSTPMGMLMENMEYLPDILPAMMTYMNSEEGQREMQAFYTDPLKAVCEDHILLRMNMPNTVPVGDIEKSICDMDWEKFGQDLMETMDWMGSMQKKIDAYNFNGTMSTVDWDGLAENMHMYLTAMNAPNEIAKDFEHLMNKMNVTKLLENFGKMDQNGMQNITMDEVNGTISAIVSAMEGLDKSLVNVSFWSYGKHVARLWMAYTNIANDVFLHTKDGINITDYIKTISPTLGDYFLNISAKFPSLFDEIMKNVQNPQTILSATLNTNWEKLCNGTKISTILQLRTTEGIEEFERGLCELNWTAIMEEIIDYNPNIKIYNDELSILAEPIDNAPRTTVNWTELATGTMKMIENLQDWFTSNMSQQVHGIDTNSLNMTLEDFMKTLTQVDQWDFTRFGGIAQELTDLLYNQDMGDNSTMWNLVMQSNMLSLYVSYHFLKFANLQLEYINTTNPIDLKKYLYSEEANKVFRAMEVSNEVNAALFGNLKDYATNPKKMTDLLTSNLSGICEDETSFGKLFSLPTDSNLTMRDLQDTVCGVNLNITKLVSELEKSVPGFKDFLEVMGKIETMAAEGLQKEDYVNITQYTAENERFSKLLESILTHPPNITVFWASPDDDMSWLIKQLEDFANFTTSGFGNQQITTTFGTIQQHLGEALSGLAQSSPEIGKIMYIADAYLKMLEHSIIQNQRGLWEDPRASLAGYPEMMKVWDLMEKLPELYETFQYTLTYDNKKISTFISLLIESFDKLCAADPGTLMTVPPHSNFSFGQFMWELCDINVTVLERESNEYNGGQIVIDAYATIDNITEPANITEMFQRLDELYNTLVDMSNNTNVTEMDVPRFLNMTIWEDIFSSSEQVLGNSTLNTANETSILSQIMDSIDELQTSMPDVRPYLNVLDLYLSVYLHNTQHQLDIRQDPANAFLDFPEMRKLWLLMEELPELYQTYVYTTFMAPDKISNFTETLMSGFESLCAADPANLMIVPSDLNFDFAAFHQKLCTVNLTVLGEESMRYNSQDNITRAYENFNNLTNPVNLNDMAKKISDLTKMTQEIYTLNMTGDDLPRFLNFTLWEGVLATVSNWSMDPDMLAQLASNSQSLISLLSGLTMTEEDKVMMRTMEALNMLLENVLDKLEAKKGTNETLRIEDFFTSSTELLKLIQLLQRPGMMEILLYASNNPQVSTMLTNPNTTDAVDELCAKDWVTFLNLPEKSGVNFTALQHEFCALNFSAFLDELYKEFQLSDVIEKISSNDTVDWRLISEQNQKLSERFSNFLATPPQFELPFLWTNETMWSELFTTYNAALTNLTSLAERVGSTLGNSDSLLASLANMGLSDVEASMLRSMEVVHIVMETILDKLEAKNGTNETLRIEDFFTSSTELLKLIKLLQTPGMMEILLYASNNPQVSTILTNPNTTDAIDELCAKDWVTFLNLPEKPGVNFTALQQEFCALNFSAFLDEILKEFRLSDMIEQISSNDTVDWSLISEQNQKLSERFSKFLTTPPQFELPSLWTNETMWSELFTTYNEALMNLSSLAERIGSTLGNSDSLLSSLSDMGLSDMEASMLRSMEAVNMFMETLIDKLESKNGTDVSWKLEDFFISSVEVLKIVHLLQKPGMMEILLYSANNPQFSAIYMNENTTTIIDDLCALNWEEVLRLPEKQGVNYTALQEEFCAVNFSAILPELYKEFNMEAVIDKMSSNDTVDWQYITQQNERLNERINKLITSPPKLDLPTHWTNDTVWHDLFTTYSEFLNNMNQLPDTGSLVDQVFSSFNNEDVNKMGAIASVLIDNMIKLLENYPDEINLDFLLNNNTELLSLVDVLGTLSYTGADDFSNGNIDVSKLLGLILDPSKLEEACNDRSFLNMISRYNVTETVLNIEKIVCMDTEAVSQALMNFQGNQDVSDKIAKILNSSEPVHVDWKTVGNKVDTLTKLMTDQFSRNITTSVEITELFNINNTLPILESLLTNPGILGQMTGVLRPWVDKEMVDIIHPVLAQMLDMMNMLQEKNVTLQSLLTNQDMLNDVIASLNTFDTQMGTYIEHAVKPAIDLAATMPTVQSAVCSVPTLEAKAQTVPTMGINVNKVSQVLCGKASNEWFDSLLDAGFTQTQMIGTKALLESLYTPITDQTDAAWARFTDTVIHLIMASRRQIETELDFTHDGTQHGEPQMPQEFDFAKLMNETLNGFISYMKIVDSDETVQDSLHELKQFFTSVANMQTFMNEQLEKGREAGKALNLTRLLPDPELVAKMLNGMQGKEYTDIITLLSLYPEKFLTIYKNGQWEEVACNPTKFYEEFQVEDGFDAEGIRKSICEAVTTNSSVFSEVLNNIQMADFINELTDWLTDGQTMPVNANVWDELLRTSNQFLKNVADLQNIDIDSLIAYGESLLKHLEKLSAISTSTSSYTAQCESTLQQFYGTEMYDTTILPVLNSIYTQTYLQYKYQILAEDMLEAMCEEQASNVTRLVDLLKMSGVPEKLKQLAKETTVGMTFSCEGMVNVSLLYAEAMNRSFTVLTDQMDKHAECLEGQMNMMLAVLGDVTQLFEVGKVMLRELNNKDFREFLTTVAGSEDILEVMEYVLQGFVQQQNWVEETNDKIQSNITELESYLEDALKISPNVLQSLVNATLKKDMGNLTAEDVVNALCGDSFLDPTNNFLAFFNSSVRDAIGLDCKEDRNTTYDVVKTLLALSKLTERLQTNIDTNSIAWWMEFGQDFSELASNIQGLSELTSLVNNINDLDLENIMGNGELLVTIQRLLINSGPESLIDNLNNILDKFGEMNDDSNEIFKDMQILTRGMLSFTTLRRLIISNVQIKDLLKEPDHFQQYLIDSIDIPKDIAQSIVDGSLSFELLINASQANLTDWICEPEKLADILNISGSQIDHKFVGETFCNLDTNMIARILDEVFKQLDIGDLVEEFITTSIDDILRDSGTSKKEVEDALDSLQNANDDLKEIIDEFGDYAANMTDIISALAQAQIGTTSPSSLSELICGESMSDIEDEFSLGDSLPSAETLTDEQKEELAELKADNEVCEKLYLDIMSTGGGPIIWGYLKPIMRGKILFSPNNEITKGIIEKINATFATIADFQEDASKLSSGATSLDNITSGEQDIVKLLISPLVESFITQFSSSGSGGFEDLIYTLNDSSSDLVSAMSKAASFMGDYIHCIELDRFVGYDSETELEQHAAKLAGKNNFLAGIVFTNADQQTVRKKRDSHLEIPTHLMYKIRMDVDNVEQTQTIKDRIWRPISRGGFADDLRYLRGFIQLQDMVDSAIIETMTGTGGTRVQPITKQTPFPCHKRDTFLNALVAYLLPVMMTFAWLAGLALATYNLVLDREDGQEETLKAMGLVFGINWWAWFISTMFIMAVVSVICTIISHYAEILPYTNFAIIFLYFLDFCFSTTLLCYFVSAFFTRASIAILVTLIVYFLSYLPYMVLITLNIQMTFWQKTLACLSSTSAFGFAAQYLAMYEEQQIGIHWDNIGTSSINGDSASFSWCCIMMVIDAGIYLILGWYVRSVKPGKYGVSEPWWFPVCPSYWSSCCGSGSQDKYRTAEQGEHFETDTSRSPKVISVRGLSKEYKRGKPVVSDLNMDVHAGQVTTLLGHNGAAKTTTMNMLTGLLEPTSGDVAIFNRPLRNMKKSIGVCPQHNSLYKYMTVIEHMEFVQSVKSGASDASSKEEIRQILEEVNLWHCRHCNVQELSGGMQRRLCVALAFVGNSKAVILDEPTSGVDPSGRRAIWNLIIRKKGAVLLSTHHLDEAEVISDKVCVLHEGRLLCSGTPLFLKEKFSSGHRMTVETAVATDTEHSAITKCIQHYVPSAVLKSSVDNEMKFVLPTSNRTNFYDLFRTLEERREELQIASFGVSDPTLEEVFLTVCKTTDILDMDRGESEIVDLAQPLLEAHYNTGGSWKFQQFGAMFVKRFHHYRRNWRLFLSAILLPVLLFLAASGLHTVRPDASQRSLLLSPAIYGPDTYFFVNDHSHGQDAISIYDTLMHSPGIATSCMDNMEQYRKDHDLICVDPAKSYTVPDFTLNPNASCSCTDYKYTCTEGSATAPPRQRMTTTGDILQNLEGRNTENYLFESFHEFIQKRYGGYSFEDDSDPSGTEPSLKSTVWYNNKGFHSLPSFYSGLSNAVLRSRAQSMKNGDPEKYGITTFNHPFTFNVRQLSKDTILQSAADLGIAATIMLAFTFIPVGIVMYSVNEFINKEKHLQFTSGIGPALYWFTSFFWDLIVLVVTTALVFAVMAIFRHDSLWARHNAAGAIVLILLYGWATLPLVYCTTKLFNSASTAFLTMFCILNFIGLVPICAVFVLNFYQHIEIIYDAYVVCQKVFLIFPTYALGAGLIGIMTNQIKTSIFERFGTDVYVDPFTLDLTGWNFIVLGIEGLVFFIFAVLLDACSACNCDCDSVDVESERYDDPDVQQEMARLVHRGHNEDTLVARNLSKVYKRAGSNFLAVDHVTFGVSRGECFGLLGVNGAGKTTTFKIITGSLNATQGSIFFSPNGYQRGTTIWQNIGYCPQEEALDSFLTVEEMLEFFGKMRGLEGQSRKIAIRNVTENLKLQPILKKTVRTCSGGMKRKLSLAIALLGDPAFVLLDEPTTGMDPVAKRLAWNCIKTAKSKGQTIVLTSHSMEECDILCSRLSILVNGQMKCLGSPQHLKDKFGDTYTIMLHVCGPLARTGKIYELVQAYFPGASIRDQHLDVIQLDIPKQTTSVSEIFRVLEREKENYNILYYTVSQNTLETIFLNFARDQHDSESEGTGSSDRSSDLTMPVDEESKLASKPLPHTRYGYMNKAYEGFGEYQVPPSQKMADPRMVTLETDSFYDTKM